MIVLDKLIQNWTFQTCIGLFEMTDLNKLSVKMNQTSQH